MPASTDATITTERDAWQAVDALLDDLDRLAASEVAGEQFYAALKQRLAGLGCAEIAIWTAAGSGTLRLQWTSSRRNAASEAPAVQAAIEAGQPRILGSQSGANGSEKASLESIVSIVSPWNGAASQRGALQAWLAESVSPGSASRYLPVLAAVAESVATFQAKNEQRRLASRADLQDKIDGFAQRVHGSLDLARTAYAIANDGRALLGCDRLSVAMRRGSRYQILAVSGAEHIHRHSQSAAELARLCARVAATGEPLWQDGKQADLPPQVSEALAKYLDVSPALALAVLPLIARARENEPQPLTVGVLVAEQYNEPFDATARDSLAAIVPHCRLALENAAAVSGVPGHRLWLAIGRSGVLARWGTRALLAAAALTAIVLTLFLVPADVKIRARGELQPAERQEVYAPRDGVVTAVHVDHGEIVQAGQTLLEMRSSDLDLELQQARGELDTTRKRLAAAQSERLQIRPGDADARLRSSRLTAEEEQLQQQAAALEEREKMLRSQVAELTLTAPVAGQVLTWNAEQRLASRPLRRGDALLTVANVEGPWQIELKVPSRQAGRLLKARQQNTGGRNASIALTTAPGEPFTGTISHVASRAQLDEAGETYVLVTVDLPSEQLKYRVPGASAVARVSCGRGSLGEAWFHDLTDAVRLWLPF